MTIRNLHDLLVHQLRDIYFAEKQLVRALPKMASAATDRELKRAFEDHLKETRTHVTRLEQVFRQLEVPARTQKCPAILGLIEEAGEFVDGDHEPEATDAGLIAAAQRVEHYEIAAYGCARAYARLLGHNAAAELLDQTIQEEGNADKALTGLAESGLNRLAAEPNDAIAARNGSTRRSAARRPVRRRRATASA